MPWLRSIWWSAFSEGSGKSTETKKIKQATGAAIVSSDVIRAELYTGIPYEEQDQKKVFEIVHTMINEHLKLENDVIYDATNLNRKKRKHFISTLGKGHEVIGYFVCPPIEVILKRALERVGTSEFVPLDKIMKVLRNFHVPLLEEGFSYIDYVGNKNYSIYEEYPVNYDQNNPYHNLTLEKHADKVFENALKLGLFDRLENKQILYSAVYYHDIGKPLTRSFRKDGFCSYIGHDNVSAYIFASSNKSLSKNKEVFNLALLLISYHIQIRYAKPQKLKRFVGIDNYELLLKLEDCDSRGKL